MSRSDADTIAELRARLAEVERERDESIASSGTWLRSAGVAIIERDEALARLAILEAAMPTAEERELLDHLYRATVEHVTGGGVSPATARAESALAKARAWFRRLDDYLRRIIHRAESADATIEILSRDAREIRDAAMTFLPAYMLAGETAAPAIQRAATHIERLCQQVEAAEQRAESGGGAEAMREAAVRHLERLAKDERAGGMGGERVWLTLKSAAAEIRALPLPTPPPCEGCGGTGVRHWRDGDAPCFQCQPKPASVPAGYRRIWIRVSICDGGHVASVWDSEPARINSTAAIVVADIPAAPVVEGEVVP
jgi:hypothetical protein